MQKEFEHREKLKQLDEQKRKEEEQKWEEARKKHKEHPKMHHPGSKQQLEEVWQEQDHMDPESFNPKTFFALHDLDGNGVWDADEVKTLFAKELDKVYDPNAPEDDMAERYEEMERMREHVFNETDLNQDRLISYQEFLDQTRKNEFERDPGWQTLDEQPVYSEQEFMEFERRRQEEIHRLVQQGLITPEEAAYHQQQIPMQYQQQYAAQQPIPPQQYGQYQPQQSQYVQYQGQQQQFKQPPPPLQQQQQVPVAQKQPPVAQQQVPAVQQQVPVAQQEVPVAQQQQVPVAQQQQVPVAQQPVPVVQQQVPVPQQQVPVAQQQVPAAQHQQQQQPQASDLEVKLARPSELKQKPDVSSLVFGKYFTDHMFEVSWSAEAGWTRPLISPLHDLKLHPGAKVLHYAIELFEGMKAYRGEDGKIRLFRPDCNLQRLLNTADRSALPQFDAKEFISCLKRLVSIEQEWVPHSLSSSLYIRPTFIGTDPSLGVATSQSALLYVILCPVGPYFPSGFKPVSLLADPQYVRAWPGGCGAMKMGSNYAPTIQIQKKAESEGHQQVLWLYGEDHKLTEVGTMNIFVFKVNKKGERELITPPLNGLILPGVTRRSLLELAREWGEFKVVEREINMAEIVETLEDNRLLEVFGAGTACVVCPVSRISYMGKTLDIPTMDHPNPLNQRFYKAMSDIQYGRVKHPWAVEIDV
nr:EOG090X051P [Eulimnadia texana]